MIGPDYGGRHDLVSLSRSLPSSQLPSRDRQAVNWNESSVARISLQWFSTGARNGPRFASRAFSRPAGNRSGFAWPNWSRSGSELVRTTATQGVAVACSAGGALMPSKLHQVIDDPDALIELDFEELAPFVLDDLNQMSPGNDQTNFHIRNYCNAVSSAYRGSPRTAHPSEKLIAQHLSVAWKVLDRMSLIAQDISKDFGWYLVTHIGKQIGSAEEFRSMVLRLNFPSDHLHPTLVAEARHSFVRGGFYNAVFDCARIVEDEVRRACGFDQGLIGQALMAKAFDPKDGPLSDASEQKAEREGLRNLATGFMLRFRNATGHARPELSPDEAIDAIHSASYLLRIVHSRVDELDSE